MKILQAAIWHAAQRRKFGGRALRQPPDRGRRAGRAAAGAAEDVVCAAFLHDAIEDQKIAAQTIAAMFGAAVAAIVEEVTDDKTLPKAERKALQIVHALHLIPGAKLVKLADKISNVRSVAASPPEDWSTERRLAYIEWSGKVVAGLRGAHAELEALFDEAVETAMKAQAHAA